MNQADQGKCDGRAAADNHINSISYEPDKLLGIQWIHNTDDFKFHLSELMVYARDLPSSKCSVLCVTAAFFN